VSISKKLLKHAANWRPDPADKWGGDKLIFLQFLLRNCCGLSKAKSIDEVLEKIKLKLSHRYTRETLQHQIMVPLREDNDVFVGTSNRGIYLVAGSEDALRTAAFYKVRIRSERKHLKFLTRIVKKNKLFLNQADGISGGGRISTVCLDESGTPSMKVVDQSPYFIVTAVMIHQKNAEFEVERKLANIRSNLFKPEKYEFKSTSLNEKQYIYTLKEIATLDYEFSSVCFNKAKLAKNSFPDPKSFYKYAFQRLLETVYEHIDEGKLFFDQYGGNEKKTFENEFFKYILRQNLAFPISKINKMAMTESQSSNLVQLADLLSGVVKHSLTGNRKLIKLPFVDDKKLDVLVIPSA
jgi:hypothetical protein